MYMYLPHAPIWYAETVPIWAAHVDYLDYDDTPFVVVQCKGATELKEVGYIIFI